MHLTLLTQYYPPEIGAPQARLSELAGHFRRRGHTVTVLTAMPSYPTGKVYSGYGGMVRRENQEGGDIIRTFVYPTQSASFVRRLTSYLSFVVSSSAFGSFLLDHSDYLLVESPPLFLGLSGFWLSRLKRARMIFNVSDLWPLSAVQLGLLRPEALSYRLSSALEAFCYRRAWYVTGQSKGILASIRERFPDCPTVHLSTGVDTTRFCPNLRSEEARRVLGKPDEFILLYAGLHGLAQGLDQVLTAAESFGDYPNVQFVLVGDGPEKQHLLQRARRAGLRNVRFLDPRPAREIPPLLASADVVLVPLKTELHGAVPSKLYEAMASGRPVILIATGEPAEIVRQNQVGLVVAPGDTEDFVRSIKTLSLEPHLRETLGHNGRRAAERDYDRSKIATGFIEHLERHL
jgi:colanic acid biosynthesis glycosyl transferase WcaI